MDDSRRATAAPSVWIDYDLGTRYILDIGPLVYTREQFRQYPAHWRYYARIRRQITAACEMISTQHVQYMRIRDALPRSTYIRTEGRE